MVHELHAAPLAPLVLIGDDAGDVAGHAGQPEGVEIRPVTEAVVGIPVHEEKGKAVLIGQHIGIHLADDFLVIGIIGPQFLNVVKGHIKVGHGGGFEFHIGSSLSRFQ